MTSVETKNLKNVEERLQRERLARAVAALASEVCVCGGAKDRRKAVCLKCWDELPLRHHRGLYRMVGGGFEYAYEGALRWLAAARGIGA